MWKLILLGLIVDAQTYTFFRENDGVDASVYKDYRLPETLVPSKYEISLTLSNDVLSGNSTTFNGKSIITFQASESINIIQFHYAVEISIIVIRSDDVDEAISASSIAKNSTTEIFTINLANNLTSGKNYYLEIEYLGTVDTVNMQGLYLSKYTVNGNKEYLVTTQLESTHARKVFPCFDEPKYKAKFVLSLTYPSGFLATSNTSPNTNSSVEDTDTTVFSETVSMSTYLLAFTISKFDCNSRIVGSTSFGVCSRKALTGDRELALNYGIKILEALDAWTNYYYNATNITKLDQIAIPDFNAGAMENWGLVSYKEMNLLWNEAYTSDAYRQQMIMLIAHEFAHMWFGNLVTPKWWNDTFLSEGFARYFQYFIVNKLDDMSTYELDKQFVIDQQHSAFLEDASDKSESLTTNVWTSEQIMSKFSSLSYSKGACIIRMIENVIGTDAFQTAVRQYISENAFGSVTADTLWTAFNQVLPSGIISGSITFDQFIDSWTNKAGYPVVTVRLNGSNVVLEQKRFLYDGTDSTQWYIPINYTLPGSATYTTTWLEPNKTLELQNLVNDSGWIIVNHNSQGYYRVNYDTTLRERLIAALKLDREQFSVLDRAQIVDDTFNLARAGEIKFSEIFKFMEYLETETSYYPLNAGIKGINELKKRFNSNSRLGQLMKNLILQLIKNELSTASITDLTTNADQIVNLKSQILWDAACTCGLEKCKLETTELFQLFKDDEINIHPNQRYLVYCNALRYSSNIADDWDFLWNRLHIIDQPHETNNILKSLGCTTNETQLKILLTQSINSSSIIRLQDFNTVWSSVYTSNSESIDFTYDFFISNQETIFNYYSKAGSLFLDIISRFTKETQLLKLQSLISEQAEDSIIRSLAVSGIQTVQMNLKWQSTVESDVIEYFGIVSSAPTTATTSLYLLVIMVFILKYV